MKKRYLVIQKGRLGWYWRLQTAKPPKVGNKIANGGQPYNNITFAVRMGLSVCRHTTNTLILRSKGIRVYMLE